jgi:hypothetical protein
MSPVEFESNLKTVSEKDREKLEIFTIKKDIEMPDPNQLKLFNN